jgi:competence protein ComEC
MSVKIHFLNVGAGDCTIVDFPSRTVKSSGRQKNSRIMMIDINDCGAEGDFTDVISYYKNNFKDSNGHIRNIFRFICTHPHKDHITGLDRLFNDKQIGIVNFWDVKNDFYPEDWENDPSPEDWKMYEKIKKGELKDLTVLTYDDKTEPKQYWKDDEDRVTIISPSTDLYNQTHFDSEGTKKQGEAINLNNTPYVLILKVNSISILFASDAENICWDYILEHHKEQIRDIDILKAAHHGRENGFYEDAVKLMNPRYIVFSNSEGYDCEHGAENLYKDTCPNAKIYKTCDLGDIICEVSFEGIINFSNNRKKKAA